ncbi:MAG: hypothetical protein HYY48_12995 [Gammaproteobacteria bacterium]|nr:hypothetical protein [Gammaproteobacteria bacterium]
MQKDQYAVPRRKTSTGEEVETRPLYVEEWLDSLPYVDFKKTSRLLHEATRATNAQPVKTTTRFELVQLYNRPYQYYVESQIKTGAQHTLQSIETMQEQVEVLKLIAVNLAYACKLSVDESLKQKTLWRQSKPPLEALLASLHFLSHALIFSFLEYAPVPKNVWRELHFVYDFAEGLGQHNAVLMPPGGKTGNDTISISAAYKRIVMASLADPHHLPFGAIWEIYEQLGAWVQHVDIGRFARPGHPGGSFVVNLDSDSRPIPLTKFDSSTGNDKLRLIDASALGGIIEEQLERVQLGQSLGPGSRLSAYFARTVLGHMQRSWGLPPDRYHPREPGEGALELTCGLNAVYYFLNAGQEFAPKIHGNGGDEEEETGSSAEVTPASSYVVESWNLVDQGPGGFAVIKKEKPHYTVRVGDLISIGHAPGSTGLREWTLGIIRWLMVLQNRAYRIGVQTIPGSVSAVAVRAVGGSSHDSHFRRALLLTDRQRQGSQSLITERGLYQEGRALELLYAGRVLRTSSGALIESAVGFEHFTLRPA